MEVIIPIGKQKLSGVESCGSSYCECYRVIVNGVVYSFEENPDDGYRSYCELFLDTTPISQIKNRFPEQAVNIEYCDDGGNEFYVFKNIDTGEVILKVGTVDYNDYYPVARFEWHPENLPINCQSRGDEITEELLTSNGFSVGRGYGRATRYYLENNAYISLLYEGNGKYTFEYHKQGFDIERTISTITELQSCLNFCDCDIEMD